MNEIIKVKDTALTQALESGEPFSLEEYSSNLTIPVCIMSPQINQLQNHNKNSEIMRQIYTVVENKLLTFGDIGKLSKDEIRAFTLDYFTNRRTETIEDLILMFDMARRGRFGRAYGKINAMVLNEWCIHYFDIKYEEFERQLQNEKHARTERTA